MMMRGQNGPPRLPKGNKMPKTKTPEAPEAEAVPTTMSTKDVAAELDTTPRTLRKFLRKCGLGVGQGSRYAFDAESLEGLRTRYAEWLAAKVKADEADEDADSAEAAQDEDDEVTA